jgi:hypothetical protein
MANNDFKIQLDRESAFSNQLAENLANLECRVDCLEAFCFEDNDEFNKNLYNDETHAIAVSDETVEDDEQSVDPSNIASTHTFDENPNDDGFEDNNGLSEGSVPSETDSESTTTDNSEDSSADSSASGSTDNNDNQTNETDFETNNNLDCKTDKQDKLNNNDYSDNHNKSDNHVDKSDKDPATDPSKSIEELNKKFTQSLADQTDELKDLRKAIDKIEEQNKKVCTQVDLQKSLDKMDAIEKTLDSLIKQENKFDVSHEVKHDANLASATKKSDVLRTDSPGTDSTVNVSSYPAPASSDKTIMMPAVTTSNPSTAKKLFRGLGRSKTPSNDASIHRGNESQFTDNDADDARKRQQKYQQIDMLAEKLHENTGIKPKYAYALATYTSTQKSSKSVLNDVLTHHGLTENEYYQNLNHEIAKLALRSVDNVPKYVYAHIKQVNSD